MSRLIMFAGRHADEVAKVDTTGGVADVSELDDNRVRKVLLRLRKNGVSVEMALPVAQAEDFRAELDEALAWAKDRRTP